MLVHTHQKCSVKYMPTSRFFTVFLQTAPIRPRALPHQTIFVNDVSMPLTGRQTSLVRLAERQSGQPLHLSVKKINNNHVACVQVPGQPNKQHCLFRINRTTPSPKSRDQQLAGSGMGTQSLRRMCLSPLMRHDVPPVLTVVSCCPHAQP